MYFPQLTTLRLYTSRAYSVTSMSMALSSWIRLTMSLGILARSCKHHRQHESPCYPSFPKPRSCKDSKPKYWTCAEAEKGLSFFLFDPPMHGTSVTDPQWLRQPSVTRLEQMARDCLHPITSAMEVPELQCTRCTRCTASSATYLTKTLPSAC